jgi:hypothetical protein
MFIRSYNCLIEPYFTGIKLKITITTDPIAMPITATIETIAKIRTILFPLIIAVMFCDIA